MTSYQHHELSELGFTLLRGAIDELVVEQLCRQCSIILQDSNQGSNARSSRGHVYAARNLIDSIPEVKEIWQQGLLNAVLKQVLGPDFGLVRALFFDKPPDRSWGLPWHKDTSIAVERNDLPSELFSRPTVKAGVPHVIASDEILRQMLTLRVHLDDVTDENGPLRVIPKSHHSKMSPGLGLNGATTIFAKAGDVLAMRPLIDHSSNSSAIGTTRHRRIIHLEFAASPVLPDGYKWFEFISDNRSDQSAHNKIDSKLGKRDT